MSAGGKNLQAVLSCQVDDRAPESHDLLADLGRGLTHRAADLHHRLMQLRLDVLDGNVPVFEDLRDEGFQLAGLRVDNLVLLLNPERERWCLHGLSFGRVKPDLIIIWVCVYGHSRRQESQGRSPTCIP